MHWAGFGLAAEVAAAGAFLEGMEVAAAALRVDGATIALAVG